MAEERQTTLKGNPLALVGPELAVGDAAPDFELTANDLSAVTLESTGSGVRIFSVVPSLDTPVCDEQTRRFNKEAAELGAIDIYTVPAAICRSPRNAGAAPPASIRSRPLPTTRTATSEKLGVR